MAVVIASALDKDMAGSPLFRGVSFKLERGDRMTLAGRNGAGKTTLLRMVSGETGIDGGELVFEKGTRVALHDQRPPRERGLSLRDYVLTGCQDLVALEEILRALEAEMAERPDDGTLLDRYSRAQSRLEHAGGWNWRQRALGPLHGLGFTDAQLDRPLSTFSGGELTRASLARALAGDPDLLLLDEPTNHLDIVSLEWLEDYLTSLDAAVILVAHDRWFLEAVGTSVLELEAGRGRFFPGTWHAWRREAAARDIQLGKQIEKQQAEIERMERFIERFRYKATKAKQAQSRVKKLDKMERVERDPTDNRSLGFKFGGAERTGRVVIDMSDARLEVPGRTLLEDGEFWIERGEHVSLRRSERHGQDDADRGDRRAPRAGRRQAPDGHNVQLGYLVPARRGARIGGHGARGRPARDPADAEQGARATGPIPVQRRGGGEARSTDCPAASAGGCRWRSWSLSGANVLILDEPTNHLDIDAREALEDALSGFDGTVLLVSHDRALLDAVGTRTIALEDGHLRSYAGGWAEYSRIREERREAGAKPKPKPKPKAPSNGRPKKPDGPSKNAVKRAAQLEREVEKAEAALRALEDELADPSAWSSPTSSERARKRHDAARKAVEEAYARWEAASA